MSILTIIEIVLVATILGLFAWTFKKEKMLMKMCLIMLDI
ncbi:hypothetical protein NRS6084_02099 [Bacillus subtilis]|nr:hypothetical protein NRS6084_02099 [Bacillus subtilis]CAF1833227.1 hypothetical protein NRS6148_02328 [Bacillus subtilis]SIQ77786.1 hypothetical protein SAMN05878487_2111 [Bacillus subtilis]